MQKIVMPKVFDEFAKNFDLAKQQGDGNLDGALTQLFNMYMYGGSQFEDLEDYMRSSTDENFYAKCVQALAYGYTVELEKQYYVAVDGTDLFFSKDDHDNLTTVKGDLDSIKRRECIKDFESISARFTEDEIVEYGLAHYPREQAQ